MSEKADRFISKFRTVVSQFRTEILARTEYINTLYTDSIEGTNIRVVSCGYMYFLPTCLHIHTNCIDTILDIF